MRFNKAKTIKSAKEYAKTEGEKATLFGLEILIGNSEGLISHQNQEIALWHLTALNTFMSILAFRKSRNCIVAFDRTQYIMSILAFRKSAKWTLCHQTMTYYSSMYGKTNKEYFQL